MRGTQSIIDDTYSFDENGNVLHIVDAAQAGLTSRDFGYDHLDRLLVADSTQQWGHASFTYDALDNLVTAKLDRTSPQGPAQDYRYGYDPDTHRLAAITNAAGAAQVTLGYDARGNVTSKVSTTRNQTLVFDAANRLSQVTGSQTYRYDGLGRRVQTTDSDGKQTYWLYTQAGQVLYSYEARRSQTIAYIYLGNSQIATRTVATGSGGAVTVHYEHTDVLGSPVAETDAPSAPGATVAITRHSYMPYGSVFSGLAVDGTGYTGHVMDADTGLTYMQQRYYDPQIGRFLSTDPVPFDPNTGANWNRYWYANNNPYRFTDPDGRLADDNGNSCKTMECNQAQQRKHDRQIDEASSGLVTTIGGASSAPAQTNSQPTSTMSAGAGTAVVAATATAGSGGTAVAGGSTTAGGTAAVGEVAAAWMSALGTFLGNLAILSPLAMTGDSEQWYGPFYRYEQTPGEAQAIMSSQLLWGGVPYGGSTPAAMAYTAPLPGKGTANMVKFITRVKPTTRSPVGATWYIGTPGVIELPGERAAIPIRVAPAMP